jgi:hypothetical protein
VKVDQITTTENEKKKKRKRATNYDSALFRPLKKQFEEKTRAKT